MLMAGHFDRLSSLVSRQSCIVGKSSAALIFLLYALKRSERRVFHDGCSCFTSQLEESAANKGPNSQPAKSRPIQSLTPRV